MFKLLFLLNVGLVLAFPSRSDTTSCNFETRCHQSTNNDKIKIHLVPHSHDDVGWLKTVDQYYYGVQNDIQNAGVHYIITSTVDALKRNSSRRFIQVETAFFWKWWEHQTEDYRNDFKTLVDNGQIEMVNGAWSMNDEAATNYQSIIDQYTLGLRKLSDTLGTCGIPKVGWQIDPFGHSREHASILKQLGFYGLFLGRLDWRDKNQRKSNKNLDFVWKSSDSLNNSEIFTSIFPEFYTSPDYFCYDILCGSYIVDDQNSPEYNADQAKANFSELMTNYTEYYKTNNILIPMGGDFQYQAAEKNFDNMDKLIKLFEEDPDFEIFYSTPSCYIKAVNDDIKNGKVKLTVKTDDFFPYASDPHAFWTGYFSSRPNSKRNERIANNILQAAKQLTTFANMSGSNYEANITSLKEAVAVMQHHDAITGTEKYQVSQDYTRLIFNGINEAEAPLGSIVENLLKKNQASENLKLNLTSCLLANVSVCETSTYDTFVVAVYNPLSRYITHYVRLPVEAGSYNITGPNGTVEYDLLDAMSDFEFAVDSKVTPAKKELVFIATNIPPLGLQLYYIEKTSAEEKKEDPGDNLKFGDEVFGFEIDNKTKLLKSITINNKSLDITQQFAYYLSAVEDNNVTEDFSKRASGAYIFRPNQSYEIPFDESNQLNIFRGKFVDECKVQFNESITQIIRLYKNRNYQFIEFDWLVGPINVNKSKMQGKEIVTRYSINNFDTNGKFYTDSNGREMIERTKDKRNDYSYNATEEPVSSNYYPITSKIVLKESDMDFEVTLLNDRAQGGSSLDKGTLELMIHRRILHDDDFGVNEPLDELEFNDKGVVARGKHYFLISDKNKSKEQRQMAQELLLAPVVLIGNAESLTFSTLNKALNFNFSPLAISLPDEVQILTLEPWQEKSYILRLEHIFGKDEVTEEKVEVDLTKLFKDYSISSIKETTLGANELLQDYKNDVKFTWPTKTAETVEEIPVESKSLVIDLKPMQIRTFIIEVRKRPNDNGGNNADFLKLSTILLLLVPFLRMF